MDIITHLFASNNIIQITPIIFCILFIAGIGAGFVDSIVGGGGLIATPTLLAVGMPPHIALATTKVQATFGSSMATVQYYRKGLINTNLLFPHAFILTVVASIIGVVVIQNLSAGYIGKIMPILMSVILVYRIIFFSHGAYDSHKPLLSNGVFIVVFASILGFYDGFFGPGIGTLWSFAFVTFLGMNSLSASGNSRFVNFASNIGALIMWIPSGLICYQVGIIMGVAQLIGTQIGVHLAIKKGAKFINIAFIVILTIIIINLFVRYY